LVSYWFYQTEYCEGPYVDPERADDADYICGSVYAYLDQALLMLLGSLPEGLTWAGWDTTTDLSNGTDVTCISHPDAARKKITFGYLINHPWGKPNNFWGISWTSGTIEQGSSGSGLYRDDNQLLIGVSSHSEVPIGCDNPDGPSGYGKFGRFYSELYIGDLLEGGSDDPAEDFDTCETALGVPSYPVSWPGLIVKSTDEDWFQLDVPVGGELVIDLSFVHYYGDIDLELYTECGGEAVASATSNDDDEHLSFHNLLPTTEFYLRIFLAAGTRQEYDLAIDLTFPECPGDADGDGDTDQGDLGILLADWGCTGGDCPGDLDGDGDADQADLGVLLGDWGCGEP
jgi:hypothetical protein